MRMAPFVIAVALAACGDPPLYETPLPNGYVHRSNGGEFGYIAARGATPGPLAQLTMQDDGSERWCNTFGTHDKWVVCAVVEYGSAGFETTHKGYLFLDTTSGIVTEYRDLGAATSAWKQLTSAPMPALSKDSWWRREL
jgi:hypothetical protein